MKTYIELGLVAFLAVLLYEKPHFLTSFADSTLGKIIMILSVAILAKQVSLNAGLVGAVIMIILLEHINEGMKNKDHKTSEKKEKKKDKDEDKKDDKDDKDDEDNKKEGYDNINGQSSPANFETTGTDQIGIDRTMKMNALHAKNAATQQINGHTN